MTGELEVSIETFLYDLVKALGGLCIKLPSMWYVGIPDRLIILPGARLGFAELKRPVGGRRGRLQGWWRKKIRELGFKCDFLKTRAEVDAFIESL